MRLINILKHLLKGKSILRAFVNDMADDAGAKLNVLYSSPMILDAGAPKGMSSTAEVFFSHFRNYTRISVEIDKKGMPDIIANFDHGFPLEEEKFDIVFSSCVLEHLQDPELYLKECYRCMKKGGTIVISVPFIFKKHSHPYDFQRFTDTYMIKKTAGMGFVNIENVPLGYGPLTCSLSVSYLLLTIMPLKIISFLLCWTLDSILGMLLRAKGKDKKIYFNEFALGHLLLAKKQ